jgi:hypothetical protein
MISCSENRSIAAYNQLIYKQYHCFMKDTGCEMQGMSERQYAAHVGLSRGAIQKAKEAERLVQHADG